MQHDPISDALNFLQQPAFMSGPTWPTTVFWVLVPASLAIAVYAFAAIPGQRRATHLSATRRPSSPPGSSWSST
jgi:hypothetical protein